MRLGKRQIDWLCGVAKPGTFYVVGSKDFDVLKDKRLLVSYGEDGSWVGITPAGLRALADAAEAGQVDLSFKPKAKPEGKA